LNDLAKKESEIEIVEVLFKKIRDEFGETSEEERKIEQLMMSIYRSSKRLPERTTMREDPSLKSSRGG